MTDASSPRHRLILGLLPLLLVLSACAGLPTSETVQRGLPVQGAPVQEVQALPVGPEADASPEQIVASFLRASSSFADDHDVARSFLTADLARQWRPTSGVLIYEGEPQLTLAADGTVTAEVTVRATVDQDGYLVEVPRGTRQTHRFAMERLGDQWRIGAFPESDGVWLSEINFERQYTHGAIHYVTARDGYLIPDVRWFPRGDGLPTSLASAQIGPVPDYLAGAATSGISEELQLVASAVPVDPVTSTATVDLRGLTPGSSPAQQKEVLAQFGQTLTQDPRVTSVLVRSAGRPLEVEGVDNPITDVSTTGFQEATWTVPFGLLRTGDELKPVVAEHYQLQDDLTADTVELPRVPIRWAQLATDELVEEFAGVSVTGDELWRWRGDNEVVMEGIGVELTSPSFDRSAGLWVAGRSTTGPRVWVISRTEPLSQAVARPLEAPWLAQDQRITSFRLAADDRRALIVLRHMDTEAVRVGVTGVVRDQDGRATSLTEPYWVAPTLTSVTSAVWSSQTELFVLGQQQSDRADRPFLVHLGGWLEPLRTVQQATGARAVPGEGNPPLIVLSEPGRIYTQERNDWGIGRNGDDLIIPGT